LNGILRTGWATGKTPLKLICKSTLKARVNDKLWEIEFHIIAGTGKPLNGHKTATDLGLLILHPFLQVVLFVPLLVFSF
jgi:hypothetical protein